MIIVTGTPRSGTSLWMQILRSGGIPVIGDPFPAPWGEALAQANPAGFYESDFRDGVYFATNPHPITGDYVFAEECRAHAVKVFTSGLVRTELDFIDRCLVTVRHWREFAQSMQRLRQIERLAAVGHRGADPAGLDDSDLPPGLAWWLAHVQLIRDCTARRYPVHFVTYDAVLSEPERVVEEVFEWLGIGDFRAAARAVQPSLRTQTRRADDGCHVEGVEGVDAELAEIMDHLFDLIHAGAPLTRTFVERLNEQQRRVMPDIGRYRIARIERSHGTSHAWPNML